MKPWIEKILPKHIDNTYDGNKIALYVFYVITVITLWRSQHHVFTPDGDAQTIATIPLDTFSKAGAQAVIGAFSLWGLSQLIIAILYVIVGIRYRALVPLMYLLIIFEYTIRATYIPAFKAIPTAGTAPGAISNLPMIIIAFVMLILSISRSKP